MGLKLQLRTMKGGVVTKLCLIVFLPAILVLWDDKGALAGSVPKMHDNSQFPKFLVLDKPGGKKSLIEIERKTGRKESVKKQTEEEPIDGCINCNSNTHEVCCIFPNSTKRCVDPKICQGENEIKNHDYSDVKCTFEGKEYMPGESRKCGCEKTCILESGGWTQPYLGCEPETSSNNNEGSGDGIADLSEPDKDSGHKSRTPDCYHHCNERLYHPVCGSDGKTYTNKCVLEEAVACIDGKQDLVVASEGECSDSGARMMNG